jgi:hypothetical protein
MRLFGNHYRVNGGVGRRNITLTARDPLRHGFDRAGDGLPIPATGGSSPAKRRQSGPHRGNAAAPRAGLCSPAIHQLAGV